MQWKDDTERDAMSTSIRPALAFLPELISPQEAAAFLNVSSRTVLSWIEQDKIPYVKLPGGTERSQYRIPLSGLVSSLTGTYDLAAAVAETREHVSALGLTDDELRRVGIEGAVADQ